ncbi:MAG: RsmB/NOP family class I SAM-dependent RNA methyltransferase, partial [Parvularculaceae bacterium]
AAAGAKVIAVDKSGPRLKRIAENLARLNLVAETIADDVLKWTPADKADAILLDAPCSATGTIRRHPDILWSKSLDDVTALAKIQAEMIDRAAEFLKPGGVLVYSVCSLQPEEGERQIEAALARRPDLSRRPITGADIPGLPGAATQAGDLRTLPSMLAAEGGLDGFFAARLIKSG